MDPIATQRLRRATAALAIAWALAAFALSIIAKAEAELRPRPPIAPMALRGEYWMVQWANAEARAAGVQVGDRVLAVDGRRADRTLDQRFLNLRDGVPNSYRIQRRDGSVIEVSLLPLRPGETRPFYGFVVDAGLPLVGAIYLAIGVAVWLMRPLRSASWAFLLFCCTMAAGLFGAGWSRSTAWDFQWFNLPFIGATAFHLFSTYPIEPGWVVRRPHVRGMAYLVAAVLGGLAYAEGFVNIPPGIWRTAASFFPVLCGVVLVGVLWKERRHMVASAVRDRADVVLFGAAISFVPILLVVASQFLFRTTAPWFLAFLWFFVFPLSVGYGIVRKQLFDIRGVARSSVAYGFTTLAVTGLFALLITSADAAFARFNINARSPWFSVAFLFFAVLAMNPLRDRLQRFVDDWFDRDHRSYRRAVREISEAMVSMLSIKEIVDRILVAVTDTMGVERAMVLILDEDEGALRPQAVRGDWEGAEGFELGADHPVTRQLWVRRTSLARESFDDEPHLETREACRDVFDTLEVEVLVPILYGVDLLGVIAVGRKLSGERLDPSDRGLLTTLANQSSVAIENAKAYDEIAQLNETLEARVEERSRELREAQQQLMQAEKMKSLGQLVAGVAHELNNPIGFVHANIQLIDENVQKIARPGATPEEIARAREALAKLVVRSREGTERVKQIVQDLRTFSRMDQADLQEVDLHEELDRTIDLMEPRCKDCISIERDYGDLPRVRCYPGQLNQVFLNLLMNACDAMEEGAGHIRVTTRPTAKGVRIEVHDDGSGIPEEVQGRIFDPFFTTKPVGKGTGLGLSLSHGIVARHGGEMTVESEPGKGTTFRIDLPLDAADAAG